MRRPRSDQPKPGTQAPLLSLSKDVAFENWIRASLLHQRIRDTKMLIERGDPKVKFILGHD
jgi:hypothetical protein